MFNCLLIYYRVTECCRFKLNHIEVKMSQNIFPIILILTFFSTIILSSCFFLGSCPTNIGIPKHNSSLQDISWKVVASYTSSFPPQPLQYDPIRMNDEIPFQCLNFRFTHIPYEGYKIMMIHKSCENYIMQGLQYNSSASNSLEEYQLDNPYNCNTWKSSLTLLNTDNVNYIVFYSCYVEPDGKNHQISMWVFARTDLQMNVTTLQLNKALEKLNWGENPLGMFIVSPTEDFNCECKKYFDIIHLEKCPSSIDNIINENDLILNIVLGLAVCLSIFITCVFFCIYNK